MFVHVFDSGYESVSAHEYEEQPEVFQAKIELLADLIRQSKSMIAYTGSEHLIFCQAHTMCALSY